MIVLEGADSVGVWSALTEFQAAEPGPVSCLVRIPPSTVAGSVQRARCRPLVRSGPRRQRDRPPSCPGGLDPGRSGGRGDRLRGLAERDGGNLILSLSHRVERPAARLGRAQADWALAEGQAGSRPARSA